MKRLKFLSVWLLVILLVGCSSVGELNDNP